MKYFYKVRGGCVLCLMCYYECKVGAMSIIEDVSMVIDPNKCVGCGKCAQNCQTQAIIKVERKSEDDK